jgi:SAM-dependent methyltransferase
MTASMMPRENGYAPRAQQALKVEHILLDALGPREPAKLTCLDLGCGSGVIARQLGWRFGRVIGLEYNFDKVRNAQQTGHDDTGRAPAFLQGDGTRLPFSSESFDLVVCAQVYEHMADAARLPAEVWRVLRPGGLCFFSGPNRFALIEDHYHLPFLSWLPAGAADTYMRLTGRGRRYDIAPLTYNQLRRMWARFEIRDYTLDLLYAPGKYGRPAYTGLAGRLLTTLGPLVGVRLMGLMPNYNWILRRPI